MSATVVEADALRERVQQRLDVFLQGQVLILAAISDDLTPMLEALTELLTGGKRLRPAFCYWGWRGAAAPDGDEIVTAAAALELLQAGALIHDDVMDDSATRRGQPSVHHRFAGLHRGSAWLGSPEAFGTSAAILLGDLALVWSDELFFDSGLPPQSLLRAKPTFDQMRTELMAGQYLDVREQARGGGSVDSAMTVARFKTAKYTIERPLHLGAALAGASSELFRTYSDYGIPLGEAFQLRDDVLGVFGDPEKTGKPAGDDLREGKRTVLIAAAVEQATPRQAALVQRHLGDPQLGQAGIDDLREVIVDTKALERVESMITVLTDRALAALEPVAQPAGDVLAQLAVAATARRV